MGPPSINPKIEKKPKKIKLLANISKVQPFCSIIKIWWKLNPVVIKGAAIERGK